MDFEDRKYYLDLEAFLYEDANDFSRELDAIIYTEDVVILESTSDIISTLVNSFMTTIEKMKTSFIEFMSKKSTKDAIKKAEDNVKEHPEIADKKVEVPDTTKLDKNAEETIKAISNAQNIDEVVRRMDKYRKQRNNLIKAGILITVTAAAAIILIKKIDNKTISDLNASVDAYKKSTDSLTATNKGLREDIVNKNKAIESLKKKNSALKDELDIANTKNPVSKTFKRAKVVAKNAAPDTSGMATEAKLNLAKAKAIGEVIINSAKDAVNAGKHTELETSKAIDALSTAKAIVNGDKSVADVAVDVAKGKANAVANVAKSVIDDVKNNGEARAEADLINDLLKKREDKVNVLNNIRKEINGDVKKTHGDPYLRRANNIKAKEVKSLDDQLKSLGVTKFPTKIVKLNK